MSMTKKDFVALADLIRSKKPVTACSIGLPMQDYYSEGLDTGSVLFWRDIMNSLADFCQKQNPNFDRERWLNYVAGNCGPSGGKI